MERKFKLASIVKILMVLVLGAMLLISARTVSSDGASVQFKTCPESAAEISDPDQTSLIYMVESYQVAMIDSHPPGRLPVREMLRQPGVSFVRKMGCPLGRPGFRWSRPALARISPASGLCSSLGITSSWFVHQELLLGRNREAVRECPNVRCVSYFGFCWQV
jgi:hypothetical protein